MAKARITNLRTERRRLLNSWLSMWLDNALNVNMNDNKAFPGMTTDDTRKILLTLKDLREDCDDSKTDIVEVGGYNGISYGRKSS